jgi:hypothetical protein
LPNTRKNFLLARIAAFTGVFMRISHCSAFLCRTLRQRLCGPHLAASELLEQVTMATQPVESLALRPRDAAKALGISARTLWGLTAPRGPIPCLRVGHGKRRTVLYPVADLQAWLSRQAEAEKGGGDDAR